jgi:xanthine dehydrogenase YagS FAD-binding subunit
MPMRDVMPGFDLYQPETLDTALELAARLGPDGWLLAGGHDSLDWFKDRIKRPAALIDLSGIDGLADVREDGRRIEIGSLITLTALERHPLVRERIPLLGAASQRVASPQIRNVGTLGGNVCQDARCWYYRYGLDCYRAGGRTCYANAPRARNREHALFGGSRCVAVTPSDTAVALSALDAEFVIARRGGTRTLAPEEFFVGPEHDIRHMSAIRPGELLTHVRVTPPPRGSRFHFEKVADRNTWDFALVSLAAVIREDGGRVIEARIACGGVACVPHRLRGVERLLVGRVLDAATIDAAATLATDGAKALNANAFKIPLMQNLVRRALRGE